MSKLAYTLGGTNIRNKPAGAVIKSVGARTILHIDEEQSPQYATLYGHNVEWLPVWILDNRKTLRGWVYAGLLEAYKPYGGVDVTGYDDPWREEPQYLILEGRTIYNLCGPLSVCWIAGMEFGKFIEMIKSAPATKSLYARIVKNDLTGVPDLRAMATVCGMECIDVLTYIKDPLAPGITPPAGMMKGFMDAGWMLICGCDIDYAGSVARGKKPHWVVADSLFSNEQDVYGGFAAGYNPFKNSYEAWRYSDLRPRLLVKGPQK